MSKDNPSGRLLVSVKPATPSVLLPVCIFSALSLSLPAAIVFLSFSVPQLDPFLLLVHSLTRCLCPIVHRGHRQTMAAIQLLHTSCADWHRGDGQCPCCAPRPPGSPGGRRSQGAESTRPNEPSDHNLICSFVSVTSVKFTMMC